MGGFYPRVWLNVVMGVFRPWEQAVIDAAVAAAPPAWGERLQAQARRLSLVQREDHGRTANMYPTDALGRIERFGPELLIDIGPDRSLLFARGTASVGGTEIFFTVHLANGRLFSMSLLDDAARVDLNASAKVTRIDLALEPERKEVAAHWPGDASTVTQADAKAAGVEMLLPEDAYMVNLDGRSYCVVGTLADGAVLLARREASGSCIFVCHIGQVPQAVGQDLRIALTELPAVLRLPRVDG